MENSVLVRVGRLVVALAGMWLLAYVILPTVTQLSPDARQLAEYIDESGIETGEFYYTGVEIVAHAEANARSSVDFSRYRNGGSARGEGER